MATKWRVTCENNQLQQRNVVEFAGANKLAQTYSYDITIYFEVFWKLNLSQRHIINIQTFLTLLIL